MFYIDEYDSKTITNTPPKREDKIVLSKAKKNMDTKQLSIFWYLSGITIANNFTEVKSLLGKYGYNVVNEEDAAVAMSDMLGTAKWAKYINDFGGIMEGTIDERIINQISSSDDAGWIEALISAVSSISSSTLNVPSSVKELQATKEKAKSQMISGISAMLSQKENEKRLINAKIEKKNNTIKIIIAIVIALAIIAYFIYKNKQNKEVGEFVNFLESNK